MPCGLHSAAWQLIQVPAASVMARWGHGKSKSSIQRKVNMGACDETILIIDEAGFSRICSAILEMMGYAAQIVSDSNMYCIESITNKLKLVITSYPFCLSVYNDIKNMDVPVIILSDQINNELINLLEDKNNTYCMMKPLDYQKFKCLISQTMTGGYDNRGGYNIV